MLLLLVATGAVAIAASGVVWLLRPEDRTDAVVTALAAGSTWVVVLVGLAGGVGALRPGVLTVLAAVAGAVTWGVARRAPRPRFGADAAGPSPDDAAGGAAGPSDRWLVVVLVVLAAGALSWQALVAAVLPPFAYDGISYHLTIVADWVLAGDLHRSELSLCCASYALNADLLFAWPVTFTHSFALVDLVQLPFVLLGGAAVAGLARSAGLPSRWSITAGALFALTPIVLVQAPTNFVDVIVSAWILAALHWAVRYHLTGDPRRLVAAGAMAGLVFGTKGTGPFWGLALAAALGLLVVLRHRSLRPVLVRGVAAGLVFLALGAPWYLRNLVATGNPLHPFRLEVAGVTLADGPIELDDVLTVPPGGPQEPELESILRSWTTDLGFWQQGSYDYQQRSGGLGPLWIWLGLPASVFWTWRWARARDPMVGVVAVVAAVFVLQPYRWWSRFTIPFAAIGAVAVAMTLLRTATGRTPAAVAIRIPLRVAVVALAGAGVVLSSYEVDPAARAEPLPAGDVVELVGAPTSERTVGSLFHPEYEFLSDVPEDATIVVDLHATEVRFVSPLFGPELTRTVRPAQGAPDAHEWLVTGDGSALDMTMARRSTHELVSSVAGVRVWAPGAADRSGAEPSG